MTERRPGNRAHRGGGGPKEVEKNEQQTRGAEGNVSVSRQLWGGRTQGRGGAEGRRRWSPRTRQGRPDGLAPGRARLERQMGPEGQGAKTVGCFF